MRARVPVFAVVIVLLVVGASGAQAKTAPSKGRADARAFHRAALEFESRVAPAATEAQAQAYLDLVRCPHAFDGAGDVRTKDAVTRLSSFNLHYLVIQEHARFSKALGARKSTNAKLRGLAGATRSLNKSLSSWNWLDVCALAEVGRASNWEGGYIDGWIADNLGHAGTQVQPTKAEMSSIERASGELRRLGLTRGQSALVTAAASLTASAFTPSGQALPLKPSSADRAHVAAYLAAGKSFDQSLVAMEGVLGELYAAVEAQLATCPNVLEGAGAHDVFVAKAEAFGRMIIVERIRRFEAFAREVAARKASHPTLKRIASALTAIASENGKFASADINVCTIAAAWKAGGYDNSAYSAWYANQLEATGWSREAIQWAEYSINASRAAFLRLGATSAEADAFITSATTFRAS